MAEPYVSLSHDDVLNIVRSNESKHEWASAWHVWTVIVPRSTITGAWARVWRRHDGRRWIYKKLAN